MSKSMGLLLFAMVGCNGFAEPSELVPETSAVYFDALRTTTTVGVIYTGQNLAGPRGDMVTWETANPLVATVDGRGTIASTGNGETVVTARQLGRSAAIRVVVSQLPASLDAGPDLPNSFATALLVGQTVQAFASASDRLGEKILNPPVVWSSLSPSVLSITPTGQIRALASGQGIVLARLGALSTQLTFNVQ